MWFNLHTALGLVKNFIPSLGGSLFGLYHQIKATTRSSGQMIGPKKSKVEHSQHIFAGSLMIMMYTV